MNTKPQIMFSLLTGAIYTVDPNDINAVDMYQVPLKCLPQVKCTKCFGRMHTGFNNTSKVYQLCNKCVPKCVDYDRLGKMNPKPENKTDA